MESSTIAGYLTYEFASIFTPEALREAFSNHEIKIYMCETTGLPVFETGNMTGQISKLGIPKIGAASIHIRINPYSTFKKLQNNEANLPSREDRKELYERDVLGQAYEQIKSQIDTVITIIEPGTSLYSVIVANEDNIKKVLKFIEVKNNVPKVQH